uniref:Uncharacterized protein n=1 Tax=Pipistrellus kuhlii TaxID=59472 RepID=A0A7J7WLK3_PIPKU|nr:hypothetical protein mPipKuh1_007975 [Pipistrellus kuhlii]
MLRQASYFTASSEKNSFKNLHRPSIISSVLCLLLELQFRQDYIHLQNKKKLSYKLLKDSTEWLNAIGKWALIRMPSSSSRISYCDFSFVFPQQKTVIHAPLVYDLNCRNENLQRDNLFLTQTIEL